MRKTYHAYKLRTKKGEWFEKFERIGDKDYHPILTKDIHKAKVCLMNQVNNIIEKSGIDFDIIDDSIYHE